MDIKEAFGRVLKQMRQEKGLSQEKLAFEVELERSYVSKLETGKFQPKLSTILIIADVLGVRAGEIVDRVDALVKKN